MHHKVDNHPFLSFLLCSFCLDVPPVLLRLSDYELSRMGFLVKIFIAFIAWVRSGWWAYTASSFESWNWQNHWTADQWTQAVEGAWFLHWILEWNISMSMKVYYRWPPFTAICIHWFDVLFEVESIWRLSGRGKSWCGLIEMSYFDENEIGA